MQNKKALVTGASSINLSKRHCKNRCVRIKIHSSLNLSRAPLLWAIHEIGTGFRTLCTERIRHDGKARPRTTASRTAALVCSLPPGRNNKQLEHRTANSEPTSTDVTATAEEVYAGRSRSLRVGRTGFSPAHETFSFIPLILNWTTLNVTFVPSTASITKQIFC